VDDRFWQPPSSSKFEKMEIGIIDYGSGNIKSVAKALEHAGATPRILLEPRDKPDLPKLLLPGVGSFGDCVARLRTLGWDNRIMDEIAAGRHLLGICLGMQLLASYSSEVEQPQSSAELVVSGLNIVPGRVDHLRKLGCPGKVPHVGWNEVCASPVNASRDEFDLFRGIKHGTDFYFVHSYAFVPDNPSDMIATTRYGVPFCSAIQRGTVWGTQFHPEKSSKAGLMLFKNFLSFPFA
jgi:glutamine amidotransferase